MFIMIFEDGNVRKVKGIHEDELMSADDAMIDIINVDTMQMYVGDGKWDDIEEWCAPPEAE